MPEKKNSLFGSIVAGIIIVVVAAYAVSSFLHGSPWYWIRAGSLTILIVMFVIGLIGSPFRGERSKEP